MAFSFSLLFSAAVLSQGVLLSAAQDLFPCDDGFGFEANPALAKPKHSSTAVVKPKQSAKVYTDECLDNADCPISKYCYGTGFSGPTYPYCQKGFGPCQFPPTRCVSRLGVNKDCYDEGGSCGEGLFCRRDRTKPGVYAVCAPQIPNGQKCPTDIVNSCLGNLGCIVEDSKNGRCGVFSGMEGTKCMINGHCNQLRGFACDLKHPAAGSTGICTRQREIGEPCPDFDCAGFCLSDGRGLGAVCTKRREIGQLCKSYRHCGPYIVNWKRPDEPICNTHERNGLWQGVCVMKSKLLHVPGQPCNPKQDACDKRRNLRCDKYGGNFVCMQKSLIDGPCVPDSPFSACNAELAGYSLECRRLLLPTNKTSYGRHICLRKRETVKIGEICNFAEHAICEEGASCVKGRGIAHRGVVYIRTFPDPVTYCLKPVAIGGDCSDKFRTFCAKGSFCVNKTCTKAKSPPNEIPMFLGDTVSCGALPCAPGLACRRDANPHRGEFCDIQTIVVGAGESCLSRTTKEMVCEEGTSCVRGLKLGDVPRCLPPGRVGAPCERNRHCKGKLECSTEMPTKCYNRSTAIPLGGKCIPKQSICGQSKIHYRTPKCLPKGRSFTCQIVAAAFDFCSPAKDIVCSDGLTCDERSFCVPSEEIRA